MSELAEARREGWDDATRGNASWFTCFSGGLTPTSDLSAGVMELPPRGGRLAPHRHKQAEIYFIVQGDGTLSIDGVRTLVRAGNAVFIPGDSVHSLANSSDVTLRVFYVFPTDRFDEVVYEFVGDPPT